MPALFSFSSDSAGLGAKMSQAISEHEIGNRNSQQQCILDPLFWPSRGFIQKWHPFFKMLLLTSIKKKLDIASQRLRTDVFSDSILLHCMMSTFEGSIVTSIKKI